MRSVVLPILAPVIGNGAAPKLGSVGKRPPVWSSTIIATFRSTDSGIALLYFVASRELKKSLTDIANYAFGLKKPRRRQIR